MPYFMIQEYFVYPSVSVYLFLLELFVYLSVCDDTLGTLGGQNSSLTRQAWHEAWNSANVCGMVK